MAAASPLDRATPPVPLPAASLPGSSYAVGLLTAINLLNYTDRYITSAVKDLFKKDLHLTDTETSLPLSTFVVVYMLTSPIMGALGDRLPRRRVLAAGVALWSVATGLAGFATTFWTLLVFRALVGVGEAAYVSICPSLFGDFFPPWRRNRVLTLFYTAVPVGVALGFTLGGQLGQRWGWRQAFMMCGFPGIVAAGLVLLVKEPPRGTFDRGPAVAPPSWGELLRALAVNREYVLVVAGYTAVTFAGGALGDWLPAYLSRVRHLDLAQAGSFIGATTVLGGLGGTLLGGILADRLRTLTRQPYLALSALSTVAASVFVGLTLGLRDKSAIVACMFFTQLFMWFYNGPINTMLVNAVDSHSRARAFALSILVTHILGDALSPVVAGAIADATGRVDLAMLVVPAALLFGALFWGIAWRTIAPPTAAPVATPAA